MNVPIYIFLKSNVPNFFIKIQKKLQLFDQEEIKPILLKLAADYIDYFRFNHIILFNFWRKIFVLNFQFRN